MELALSFIAVFTVSVNLSNAGATKREKLSVPNVHSAALQHGSDRLLSSGRLKVQPGPHHLCRAPNDLPVDLASPLKVREKVSSHWKRFEKQRE